MLSAFHYRTIFISFMKFVDLVIEYFAMTHPNQRTVDDQKINGMNLTPGFFSQVFNVILEILSLYTSIA